jgi:hypothetical protein
VDAWADVDGDGDPDRFVGFRSGAARLYRNDGPEGFVDMADGAGLTVDGPVTAAAWGDVDGDGDPDLVLGLGLGAAGGPGTALWRNDGGGVFSEATEEAGLRFVGAAPAHAAWADVDGDGDLDLFLAVPDGPDRLWRNDGGTLNDVTGAAGLADAEGSSGAVFLDADGDGDLDLLSMAALDGRPWLRRNDGAVFAAEPLGPPVRRERRQQRPTAEAAAAPCLVDVDGDGHPDLHLPGADGATLLRNPGLGGGSWDPAPEGRRLRASGPACTWGDLGHDGRAELVAATPDGSQAVHHPESGAVESVGVGGAGPGSATEPPRPWAGGARGPGSARLLDVDGDGDLDLALVEPGGAGHPLLRNLLRPEFAGHALRVRVVDREGRATRAGAVVRLRVPGSGGVVATGVVDAGSGGGQSELPVHLAVPGGQPVVVEVVAPGPGGPDTTSLGPVDPAAHRGGVLEVRTGG